MEQQILLQIRGVSHAYPRGAPVLHDISFGLLQGEILSVIGPSGCGKTTLLKVINGLADPVSGYVALRGRNLTGVPVGGRKMGLLFQQPLLFPQFSVRRNIELGAEYGGVPKKEIPAAVAYCAKLLGIEGLLDTAPGQPVSGGERQRVALAHQLISSPELLLLDEPLSSLDQPRKHELKEVIHSILREKGIAAVWVTHDQVEALTVADRVVVMQGGKIEQIGTPQEIIEHPATDFVRSFVVSGFTLLAGRVFSGHPYTFDSQGRLVSAAQSR